MTDGLIVSQADQAMQRVERDESREHRIAKEVTVDAYTLDEQALGWYYYLEDKMNFPFEARCITEQTVSPLEEGEEVRVVGMPSEEVCRSEIFVSVHWMDRELGVPLRQLESVEANGDTQEAIADWHYWVGRGHRLC